MNYAKRNFFYNEDREKYGMFRMWRSLQHFLNCIKNRNEWNFIFSHKHEFEADINKIE